ncbi:HU family DNA-binding protein [bacterium]|nr:HU family DNA-binding protein [candidate division CSSED10-310 bacterium]
MNFNELAHRISLNFPLNQRDSKGVLRFILEEIEKEVKQCKRVYFRGFGSFVKELKPARKYRDPISGKIKRSPEDLRVRFRSFIRF